jgi:hypothetical protein
VALLRKLVPVSDCAELFPELQELLPAVNQALRNINRGKMDFLPYYAPVAGYALSMRADLIPQGSGKPPAMGRWQIEVTKHDASYRLLLGGKADRDTELAELIFLCEHEPQDHRHFPSASDEG